MTCTSPLWIRPQRYRQHGLQPDRAGRGFRKRQALGVDVLRVVVGHHHVDQAVGDGLDQATRSSSARSGGDSLRNVR